MQTSTNNLNKTQALLQISFCLAVEKRAIYYFSTCFGHLIFLLVLDIVLVHLYFSIGFGYDPCTSLFFYWFWILSLYTFIFLLVLDIVLVHLYFSTCFGDICHLHFLFVGIFWKIAIDDKVIHTLA